MFLFAEAYTKKNTKVYIEPELKKTMAVLYIYSFISLTSIIEVKNELVDP